MGIYLPDDTAMYTYFSRNSPNLEEVFRHEYVHYLADFFIPMGLSDDCLLTWFQEGLAEFLVGSTQARGVTVSRSRVENIIRQEAGGAVQRYDPAQIFDFCYSSNFGFTTHYYNYSSLFFHFMYQQRRSQLLELINLVRNGYMSSSLDLIDTWAKDTQLAADYSAFVDDQIANVDQLPYHPSYSIFSSDDIDVDPRTIKPLLLPASFHSDNSTEIESALQQINGNLDLDCQTVITEPNPRFECTGSLPAGSQFSEDPGELNLFQLFTDRGNQLLREDRGPLNEHLNARLDSFIVAVVADGAINNLDDMTCYFINAAGSPPVADLYCEGPLRPMDLALAQVDLKAALCCASDIGANADGFGPVSNLRLCGIKNCTGELGFIGEPLSLWTTLGFSAETVSNVTMTWSTSLPVRIEVIEPWFPDQCEIVETTEQAGTIACGPVYDRSANHSLDFTHFSSRRHAASRDGIHLELPLYLTPLEAGLLDFSVEFSSDEPEIEPADNIASVQWTISHSRESSHIATLSSRARSVAFSPDGTILAVGTADGIIQLWHVATKTHIATLEDSDYVVDAVAFSPDGTTLAAGMGDGTIKLWNVEIKLNTAILEAGTVGVQSVAFSPDGTTLAAGMGDSAIKLWNAETDNTATLGASGGQSVAFSSDATTLVVGNTDLPTLLPDFKRFKVAFSPDGTILAVGALNRVRLWNVVTKTNIANLSGHHGYLTAVAFSPDGTTLASGAADATVRLWDVATKISIATLTAYSSVGEMAFSPDGTTLAVGMSEKGVELWDVATKTKIVSLSGHSDWVHSVAFSPDGTILASGSDDGTVKLWDVAEWKRAKRLARAEERIGQPDGPQLAQNAPNPFNSQTVLSYFLHAPGPVRLEVFSLTGQRVAVLHQGPQKAGYRHLRWDAHDDAGRPVASGMYLYRLVTNDGALTRKLVLLR